jgi:hypothetical protein
MKLTITKTSEAAGKETWVAAVEGFENAAERFTHYTGAGFHFVTLGVSSLKSERADCKDGDVLASICKIAGMKILARVSDTAAEVEAE